MLLIFLAGCLTAGAEPKRVMLIHSFGRDFAPYNTFSAVLRSELVSYYSGPVDVLEVTLDSARSGDTVQEELLVDYLASLSSLRRLDLVIPIGGPAVRFAQGHRERFFSGIPMLISGADERHVKQPTLTRNDAVVAAQIEPSRVVQTILQLLPDTKNIVVVAGASPLEKFWIKELRADFQPFADRVTFQWMDELSFDEMLERCAKLPPQTAIFYALLAVDAKGIPQWDEGTVNRLHQVANAPIFGVFESQLGRGIVGGPLMDMQKMARNTAQVASRILHGEVAGDIRTAPQMMGDPQFDWRELRHWKIPESNLPPGSTLKFRQPDFWERYRWLVIGVTLLGLFQAALIVGLLVNRKRRIRGEMEAIELRSTLAHSGRVTLLGQLASALAHELSQPLGAILRNAEAAEIMLQDASPDIEEMRAIIDDILRDDHRAGQVIDKLRSLLKNGSIDVQPVDLPEVIDGVLSLVQPDANSRHILISRSLPPDLPLACGDKIHLQQVLINLLVNAMDVLVGQENGQRGIWLHVRQIDDKMLEVRVCDNGPGIPDGQFERLFEPFFTTKKTGMGMGLPVSKTIIEAHKGKLWAENRPEGGACFCFTVPIAG
jgi:signal transduction histidine kinase